VLNPIDFFIRYEETKGLAIIQDFTANCAIKNERMVQVLKFDYKSEYEEKTLWFDTGFSPQILTFDQIFKIAPFTRFL
jgi:hypothetical protein